MNVLLHGHITWTGNHKCIVNGNIDYPLYNLNKMVYQFDLHICVGQNLVTANCTTGIIFALIHS